ncbi:transposase [Enterococcus sp. PF1-24]|uniref:transposase n=1 Tax=unclassified Enterococcus TaxID=2608891 RepID=UPI002475A4A6|nr:MULTISPECIES: transposase [unclassified Enterococcus]MDH6363490.1 transposase [Enterococcus sp. PFB1-1]MDH6400584.1 transposase [Enterococcus sp. PF1-24]
MKSYTKEFKESALAYRKEHPELSVKACCRNLDISAASYYKWEREAKENEGNVVHRGSGNFQSDEAKEIARLKRELKNQTDALAILKKAIGILGDEQR